MDQKQYMEDVYSHYWATARNKLYNNLVYDKNLIELINCNNLGPKILEVAVGTGEPFANYFQKKGFQVYGIDISSLLVNQCISSNSKIKAFVGDAENICFNDNYFDTTYCFHSSWYFPNIYKAIQEMIRVTKPSGFVYFDIQNSINNSIIKAYAKKLHNKNSKYYSIYHKLKYIIKFCLKVKESWSYTIFEIPTNPHSILNIISKNKYQIFGRGENDEFHNIIDLNELVKYQRLIFKIQVESK